MMIQLVGEGLQKKHALDIQKLFDQCTSMSPRIVKKVFHIGICIVQVSDQDFNEFYTYCIEKKGDFKNSFGNVTVSKNEEEPALESSPILESTSPLPSSTSTLPPFQQQESKNKNKKKRVYTREEKDRRNELQKARRQKQNNIAKK